MTHRMTRRLMLAGAGASTAALPRLARAELTVLEEEARSEGMLTWYIAQVDAETAEALGRTFTQMYPEIRVAVIRTTGQVAYQRLMQEMKNNAPQCDVFSTTDISHMPVLKELGALARYVPQNAVALLPQFDRLADPGYYYPNSATNHFIIINTDKVKSADAPRGWGDLLDPKWKGQIALPHPAFSGCGGVWALGLRKLYGWAYFDKLARNKPRIGRSFVDPATLVTSGECTVGAAPANSTFPSIAKGNPLGVVYPADGCSVCVGPSGIPTGAPHPNAARLFMEFLLSETYSRLSVARGSESVRAGIAPLPEHKSLEQLTVMNLSVAEIRSGIPEVIEQWRDTFGG